MLYTISMVTRNKLSTEYTQKEMKIKTYHYKKSTKSSLSIITLNVMNEVPQSKDLGCNPIKTRIQLKYC